MSRFVPIEITNETVEELGRWLESQETVFPFSTEDSSSLLICHVLSLEIGGPNDDLSRFIYDEGQKRKVDRSNLKAKVGLFDGHLCVQITGAGYGHLRVTLPDLREVVTCLGSELIISPAAIATYIKKQSLSPVFAKSWVQQAAFSSFNLKTQPLLEQLWVLKNNDTFLYSKLVAKHQVVFQGMHDIVGHIGGIRGDGFEFASQVAAKVAARLESYFGGRERGNLPSHLIPFLIGLLLDDLTQKSFYFSAQRAQAIDELLKSLDDYRIDPQAFLLLNGFPKQLNDVLQTVRDQARFSVDTLRRGIEGLLRECRGLISEAS